MTRLRGSQLVLARIVAERALRHAAQGGQEALSVSGTDVRLGCHRWTDEEEAMRWPAGCVDDRGGEPMRARARDAGARVFQGLKSSSDGSRLVLPIERVE